MPHFTGILIALVSLAAITYKVTARAFPPSNKFDHSRQVAGFSQNNNNYYIQLLVFVDSDLYLVYKDEDKVRDYVMKFWKGVDMRLQDLKTLKISISISDVIIAQSPVALPYLVNNTRGNKVAYDDALRDMGKYLYHNRSLPPYDIAVQMTRLDLCEDLMGTCTTYIKGSGTAGGACMVNPILEEVKSVLIVKDSGGYSGIIYAAHELGHVLGSPHDGEELYYFPQAPGSKNCSRDDGYIMGKFNNNPNSFQWSSCTEQTFIAFLKTQAAECLLDGPHKNSLTGIPMPGKMMSLDEQCLKHSGTQSFYNQPQVCLQLYCYETNHPGSRGVTHGPAAEGSECGEDLSFVANHILLTFTIVSEPICLFE